MEKIKQAIKGKVKYDPMGTRVTDEEHNHILDIRGWGRYQYMKDGEKIQDAVGQFIVDAINEKIDKTP